MKFKGLTNEEVVKNRKQYGENKLPEKPLKKWYEFFLETFQDKINMILLVMLVIFVIMFLMGKGALSEPIGIGSVLFLVSVLGVINSLKMQKSAKELRDKTSVHYCNVLRNGEVKHINTHEVVVGDIVLVQSGEEIYADGYLVDGKIKVNNSVLNGESDDCLKEPIEGYVYDNNKQITGDDYVNKNSLFSGTQVTDGEGKMIVTKVGVNTVNGHTIMSIDEIEEAPTSLQIQLDDLADQITTFGYIAAIAIVVVLLGSEIFRMGFGAFISQDFITIFENILTVVVTAITVIVAAVPEGLPLIIKIITAQNSKVMLKNNILAKNTNKIPEAGNVQLLCTDKTGTLTYGQLIPVTNVDAYGNEISNYEVDKAFNENIILNSSAMYDENGEIIGGNATERALFSMVSKVDVKLCKKVEVLNKLPFNSKNKYSAITIQQDDHIVTYYKGAPEKLVAAANGCVDGNGEWHEIDKKMALKTIKSFTSKAMRVIATAVSYKEIGDSLPDDLIITSFVAIRDDVRKEVPEAVKKCQNAGVQVMMITGDVIDTAKAIAVDAGLITEIDDIAVSATELDTWSDEEVKSKLSKIKVIARATPTTKQRIVKLAQELNMSIAMCGDGVNDAPALKQADVGFAMGSGTDTAKEAGDIIIIDDNFVSITNAILLGRTFMHNVMKFLKFQLPINIGLVILSVLCPIVLGVQAISAVQILVINIVMDTLNSLSFGGEPAKDEYMLEQPIQKGSKLLSKETLSQIIVSTAAFIGVFGITLLPVFRQMFVTEEVYLTARFALLISIATINGFNIRTDGFNLFKGIGKNKLFIEIAIGIFVGLFLLVTFGEAYLNTVPLSTIQWLSILGLSLLIIPIDMVRKIIIRKKGI